MRNEKGYASSWKQCIKTPLTLVFTASLFFLFPQKHKKSPGIHPGAFHSFIYVFHLAIYSLAYLE